MMTWSPYLTGRARAAFPGVMLLRVGVDQQGTRFLDRTVFWDNWLAYRGFVWEFGGGVYTNMYRAVYVVTLPARKLVQKRRTSVLVPVRNLESAIEVADVCYAELVAATPSSAFAAVDGLPWDLHHITDQEARRAAGAAYLTSVRELDVQST